MTVALAFLAGMLSILSPCVLPLVPIVLSAAVSEHRLGPVALAAGLAISFVAIGMFVATIGFSIGLDGTFFRGVGGALLAGLGLVLLVPGFQAGLATAAGPMSNWAERRFGGFSQKGPSGQFALGLLLAPSGRPAWGRPWGRHRCWRHEARISGRSRSPWGRSGSARLCRCLPWAYCLGTPYVAGVAACCQRARGRRPFSARCCWQQECWC